MNYYVIYENNSGGYSCNPKGASYIVIKANTEEEATDILESQEWYTEEYCECCGERWGNFQEIEDTSIYIDLNTDLVQFYDWDKNSYYEDKQMYNKLG